MADVSAIAGIVLMVIGGFFVAVGLLLCYTTKGEYYNQEEVQAMVAAEVLEDEKRKRTEAEEAELAIKEEMLNVDSNELGGKKKRLGPLVAT